MYLTDLHNLCVIVAPQNLLSFLMKSSLLTQHLSVIFFLWTEAITALLHLPSFFYTAYHESRKTYLDMCLKLRNFVIFLHWFVCLTFVQLLKLVCRSCKWLYWTSANHFFSTESVHFHLSAIHILIMFFRYFKFCLWNFFNFLILVASRFGPWPPVLSRFKLSHRFVVVIFYLPWKLSYQTNLGWECWNSPLILNKESVIFCSW